MLPLFAGQGKSKNCRRNSESHFQGTARNHWQKRQNCLNVILNGGNKVKNKDFPILCDFIRIEVFSLRIKKQKSYSAPYQVIVQSSHRVKK